MGTAEVCYDFRDVANYLIVSSLDVPAPGFPYHNFMTNLYEGTIKDFTEVCKHYVDFYRYYPSGWASVALIDINQINALASSIKHGSPKTSIPSTSTTIFLAGLKIIFIIHL